MNENDNNENLLVESDNEGKNEKIDVKKEIFDWLEILVHAILVVVLCFSFLFRIATINGSSMENTLHEGERVMISNLFYTPKNGDIVVISRNKNNNIYEETDENTRIIKRIIATEGQTVNIDFEKGVVYVDGVELDEPYVKTPTNRDFDIEFPVTVDEGCVFVLGDNRNDSLDSRSSSIGEYGMVDTRYILGKAVFRIFPFDKVGGLYG